MDPLWIRAWIMPVDSLISIEPVHTHCMHARIQNSLSEGVVRKDWNPTKNGPPSAHQRNAIVDNGPPLNACWLGSFVMFRGSGSILLGNPIFLWFFRGSGPPVPPPPSGSAHGMHLKEGTCLKCSFQRVVIIGRKVGLDYNSCYACLPLIRHVGRSSRDGTVFAHESFVLAWFLKISKHNVWVSQSILLQLLPMRTQNSNLPCASAFVRQSHTFHSINALRPFYRMHTFLNWRNVLSWIPFGSDLVPNLVCKCREGERERETGAGTSK